MQQAIATKPPPAAQVLVEQQKQAHREALLVGSSKVQSAYYHRDGRPWESSNRQEVHWGDNSMLQTGAPDDDNLSIQTDEHMGIQYLKDDREPTFIITECPDYDLAMDRVTDEPQAALGLFLTKILAGGMVEWWNGGTRFHIPPCHRSSVVTSENALVVW
jgi:hypothetical protein